MESKELRLKRQHAARRTNRTRSRLRGTADRPRLMVRVSLQNVSAQVIDDTAGRTLAAVTTVKAKAIKGKSLTEKAAWVGEHIATTATAAKVTRVVFDRGAKQYHGRIAALAEAARKNGLEF